MGCFFGGGGQQGVCDSSARLTAARRRQQAGVGEEWGCEGVEHWLKILSVVHAVGMGGGRGGW